MNVQQLATSICQRLFDEGYIAYFAGGWVRDLLLHKSSHEIDIATSAPPHIIQRLFPKTVAVGIQFGVIVVVLEGINFEVTTFRKDHPYQDGRHPEGVDYSTPEKDAERRDFTINGMFYDPLTETIFDFVGGKEDLQRKIIRAIGNPHQRFAEDRLRMIRAVRFAARLGFAIESETAKAIEENAHQLFPAVSMERIWQEFQKMSVAPRFDEALLSLHRLKLLPIIFPQLKEIQHDELKQRVAPFPYYPPGCPASAFLVALFPTLSLPELIAIGRYLKVTVHDLKLIEFLSHSKPLLEQKPNIPYDWAHFYAHPHSELALHIEAAHILPPAHRKALSEHETRKASLHRHIERIQKRTPLVSAALLQQKGIKPGIEMGRLLREAEKISINEDLHDPEIILNRIL